MKNPNHELITMKDMFMFEKKIKKKENGHMEARLLMY